MDIAAPLFKLARYASALRAAHARSRAERMINAMPAHLRKDIGWPDACPERRARRF